MATIYILKQITSKEAEEKLATLAAIVDSSDDAIISKTLDGNITSWNRGAERIFGYSEREAIGKHISFIIPPELLSEEQMVIDKIRRGQQVLHFETERMGKDGRRVNISLTVSPVKDNTGKVIGASKIARDITEHKRAQEKIIKSEQKLKETAQRTEDFIKIASHELKTPITTIKGYLQLMLSTVREEEQFSPQFITSSLLIMEKQVEKLTRLMSELLDMSKIEVEQMEITKDLFSLNELVNETVQDMLYANRSNKIDISHDFACNICGDRDRIGQVVSNLLTNAIKYSPGPEKKVEIKIYRQEKDRAAVSIKDYGIGIDKKDQQKIFERFFRAEGQYQQTYPGFGLGLFIAKEILQRHNGTISVESEKEKGSTFTFILPAETGTGN